MSTTGPRERLNEPQVRHHHRSLERYRIWSAAAAGSGLPSRVGAMQFGGDGVTQLVPALLELGEAFALELIGDVFEADADGCQLIEDAACIVVSAPDGSAGHLAVVGEGCQGGSGHGVDGVGGDELGHVHSVGIGGVLDAGGGPERALRLSSEPSQLLPSLAGDDFLISLVGQAGVGDSRLSLELRGLAGCYPV